MDKRIENLFKAARKSGHANLANLDLKAVPEGLWKLSELTFGEKWWELVELTKLDLSHNELTELSPKVSNVSPELSVLLLSYNKLAALPAELGALVSLKKLAVAHNVLSAVPADLCHLSNVVDLSLANNRLTALPDDLFKGLDRLEFLALEHNRLETLPPSLASCTGLQRVTASNNVLSVVPAGTLSNLRNLTHLDLSKNHLVSLPPEIWRAPLVCLDLRNNRFERLPDIPPDASPMALTELYLSINRLDALPVGISRATKLSVLDVADNTISALPDEIAQLKQLKLLDLSNNALSTLPPSLGTLTRLTKLILDGNPLRTIRSDLLRKGTTALLEHLRSRIPAPESAEVVSYGNRSTATASVRSALADAAYSKHLDLARQQLTALPDLVFDVAAPNLTRLDLSCNKLETISPRIAELPVLRELILAENAIVDLPSALPPALTFLNLRKNRVVTLAGIKAGSVRVLDLSQNPIDTKACNWLGDLPALEELLVSQCRLRELPAALPPGLTVLDLSGNQVEALPALESIPHALVSLDLSNNSLRTVPPELGLLTGLRTLNLEGNPQRTVRHAILTKGTAALLAFLRDRIVT